MGPAVRLSREREKGNINAKLCRCSGALPVVHLLARSSVVIIIEMKLIDAPDGQKTWTWPCSMLATAYRVTGVGGGRPATAATAATTTATYRRRGGNVALGLYWPVPLHSRTHVLLFFQATPPRNTIPSSRPRTLDRKIPSSSASVGPSFSLLITHG